MEENNVENKRTTIADLTVNQFMWRVIGWLILHGAIAFVLLLLFLSTLNI